MSIEAMKQALEALEGVISAHGYQGGTPVKAIPALRQAIEQGEHIVDANKMGEQAQPVAWLVEFENGEQELHFDEQSVGKTHTPLYTTPPSRKPLTDEEIEEITDRVPIDDPNEPTTWHLRLARAIEAAHGIKGDA